MGCYGHLREAVVGVERLHHYQCFVYCYSFHCICYGYGSRLPDCGLSLERVIGHGWNQLLWDYVAGKGC